MIYYSEKTILYFFNIFLDMIDGFTSEISKVDHFFTIVGDSINSILPDLPLLSILPSPLVI